MRAKSGCGDGQLSSARNQDKVEPLERTTGGGVEAPNLLVSLSLGKSQLK